MRNLIYKMILPLAGILPHFQKQILEMRFYKRYRRRVEWSSPQSFYDKIIWMSCYADTTLWTWLADKYRVREYVAARCGENVLPKLYGAYNRASDIDYDIFPNRVVLKTNNGCASNILVKDKTTINKDELNNKLDYWLSYPYGQLTGQLHYAAIKPQIIAEEYLTQNADAEAPLIDYKFFCFNGEPLYCYVMSDRQFNTHYFNRMLYDMQWHAHPEFFDQPQGIKEVERPVCFEQMKQIARSLSQNINMVRVDLYEVNGTVKFGEMTFMPGWSYAFNDDILLFWGGLFDEEKLISAEQMKKLIGLDHEQYDNNKR